MNYAILNLFETLFNFLGLIYISVYHIYSYMYLLFQDVLENDDIQLDSMFIASIVFDILRVCCVAIIRRDI